MKLSSFSSIVFCVGSGCCLLLLFCFRCLMNMFCWKRWFEPSFVEQINMAERRAKRAPGSRKTFARRISTSTHGNRCRSPVPGGWIGSKGWRTWWPGCWKTRCELYMRGWCNNMRKVCRMFFRPTFFSFFLLRKKVVSICCDECEASYSRKHNRKHNTDMAESISLTFCKYSWRPLQWDLSNLAWWWPPLSFTLW